jgi:hypothetical protein
MKSLIIIAAVTCVSCVWIQFISKPDYEFIFLSYNAKDHTLRIANGSSGAYISKVELDLHNDTLSVKVYKRLIFIKPTSIINSSITDWRIKLKPNTRFVRFGKTLKPFSELQTYPVEGAIYHQTIEIFPQKYPYVGK